MKRKKYSTDLKRQIAKAYQSGMTAETIADVFQIPGSVLAVAKQFAGIHKTEKISYKDVFKKLLNGENTNLSDIEPPNIGKNLFDGLLDDVQAITSQPQDNPSEVVQRLDKVIDLLAGLYRITKETLEEPKP